MFSYLARSRRLATCLVVFFYKIINILPAAPDQPTANQDSRYLPSFKNHPCVEGQFLCLVIAHDFCWIDRTRLVQKTVHIDSHGEHYSS